MKDIVRFLFFLSALFVLGTGCKSKPPVTETPDKFQGIFAGAADVFILMSDNTLWGAGYNHSGQLGLGEAAPGDLFRGEPVITQISDGAGVPLGGVQSVAAGENHTVLLKDDGSVWGAGISSFGELGLDGEKLPFFTRLKAGGAEIAGVKAIAAGNNSTFYINSDGSLWAAGYNYYGELGLGNRDARLSFAKVESAGQNVKSLVSGFRHTALLKEDGTLWTAGYNFNGQLGLGDDADRNTFTQVTAAGSGITAVAAGNYHTVILKNDGSVWTAGSNYWGQLGFSGAGDLQTFTRVSGENGGALTGVREIAARGNITVLIKEDGSLLLAGNYTDSEGEKEPDPGAFFVDGDDPAGKLDTSKSSFVPLVPEEGTAPQFGGVKKIVLGYNSVYVIASDGSLWAAGSNRYGQLSLGLDTEASPVLRLIDP